VKRISAEISFAISFHASFSNY